MSLARFDDGGPDLAIRHGPGHWPGLRARHLMDDALFPVAAPSLRGVDGIAGPGDLLAFPLLSDLRSEEHTSELQSLMRISYAVFCLKKKKQHTKTHNYHL